MQSTSLAVENVLPVGGMENSLVDPATNLGVGKASAKEEFDSKTGQKSVKEGGIIKL